MSGWYLMHRGWMASPDFQAEPFTEREAFVWSIEQAAYKAHDQWFNGSQFSVERSEFVTSIRKMAATFGWGEKRVRLFMARMAKRQKWALRPAHEGAHGPTILTVCNYDRFQASPDGEGAPEDAAKDAARAQRGRSEGAQQKEGLSNSNEGEARKLEASPLRAAPLPYDDALAAWTEAASVKGWKPLNPQLSADRRKGLGSILKSDGLAGFVAVLQRAMDSEWLGGPDPPAWFNFTFICKPTNFLKVKEGNYDRSFSTSSSAKQSPWLDARAQLGGGVSNPASGGLHAEPAHGLLRISASPEGVGPR